MALKYIIGDFKTGAISESSTIPVIKNSEKLSIDVNGTDALTVRVSLKDLPSDWRTLLKPGEKTIALVDDERSYTDGVLWAGFINKVSAVVNGAVSIQVAGLREYLASRSTSKLFDAVATDPNTGTTYTADTYQGIMKAMIQDAFSAVGIPAGKPTPPAVLGTVSGVVSGSALTYKTLDRDLRFYHEALDEVANTFGSGEEYMFKARWASAAKTNIVWDCIIGTAAVPHLNENLTLPIVLADNAWQPISFNQSQDASRIASRIVAQSKYGDEEAGNGADISTKTSTAGTTVLFDHTFNPGVELTEAEMNEQLNARIAYASNTNKTAGFTRVYTTVDNLLENISQLGRIAQFSGTGAAEYFGLEMRIVSIAFSASDKIVEIGLMQKAARYPKLPNRPWSGGTPGSGNSWSGGGPIVKPLNPNVPIPGGGGGGGGSLPPFELPSFKEESPVSISGVGRLGGVASNASSSVFTWIDPSTIRQVGNEIFFHRFSKLSTYTTSDTDEFRQSSNLIDLEDFKVYRAKLDELPVSTTEESISATIPTILTNWRNDPSPALAWSEIFAKHFSKNDPDLEFIAETQLTNNETVAIHSQNRPQDVAYGVPGKVKTLDLNTFANEEWVYVQAVYGISNNAWRTNAKVVDHPLCRFKVKENTWRIARNEDGSWGTTWEDMGSIFTFTHNGQSRIWVGVNSTFIYDGRIQSLFGYALLADRTDDDYEVKRSLPTFTSQYYSREMLVMELDGSDKDFFAVEDLVLREDAFQNEDEANLVDKKMQIGAGVTFGVRDEVTHYLVTSLTYTNRRETFSISKANLKAVKIMDSNTSPGIELFSSPEILQKLIGQGLGPVKIGSSIIDLTFSGVKKIVREGSTTKFMAFTNRAINLQRGKEGFTDTVLSSLKLDDFEFRLTSPGNVPSGVINNIGFPIRSELKSGGHSIAALNSIYCGLINRYIRTDTRTIYETNQGSGTQSAFLDLSNLSSTSTWLFSSYFRVGSVMSKSWTMGTGVMQQDNLNTSDFISSNTKGVRNAFWWGYSNGFIYIFLDDKAFGSIGEPMVQVMKLAVDLDKL